MRYTSVCACARLCVCVPIHPTSVTISPPSFGNTICFWSFSWPHGYVRGYTSNLWSYMAWYLQCRFLKYHWQLFAGGSRTHRLAGFSWSKPLCSTCGRNACGEFRAKIFSKRKVSGSSLIPNKPGRFIISTGYSNGPLIHPFIYPIRSFWISKRFDEVSIYPPLSTRMLLFFTHWKHQNPCLMVPSICAPSTSYVTWLRHCRKPDADAVSWTLRRWKFRGPLKIWGKKPSSPVKMGLFLR